MAYKTYDSPVTVTGKFNKKYTPEELCVLMGVCNGGLRATRLYFQRWGCEKMSLMQIMETATPEDFRDSGETIGSMDDYQLNHMTELRSYLLEAAAKMVLFRKFPYVRKAFEQDGKVDFDPSFRTSISEFDDEYNLSYNSDFGERSGMDKDSVAYQIFYDLAHGLLPVEILWLELCYDDLDDFRDDVVIVHDKGRR